MSEVRNFPDQFSTPHLAVYLIGAREKLKSAISCKTVAVAFLVSVSNQNW
jgi:hypothetical protein